MRVSHILAPHSLQGGRVFDKGVVGVDGAFMTGPGLAAAGILAENQAGVNFNPDGGDRGQRAGPRADTYAHAPSRESPPCVGPARCDGAIDKYYAAVLVIVQISAYLPLHHWQERNGASG
jgi:hypothetical protein